MKKLGFAVSVLLAALVSVSAQAASPITKTFPVNITLTSACVVTTPPVAVTFTYTSLQTTSATATGTTVGITCTNTLPYSVSLAPSAAAYTITDQATNLIYTLTLNGAANDLAGQVGNGAEQIVNIGGTMAAGQAGTCNTSATTCSNSASTNLTQTVTITY
jgi:spore coat protein U-like protein